MLLVEAAKRLEHADAVCSSLDATPADIREAIASITQLQGFIDARLAALLHSLDAFPTTFAEATLSEATGCSMNEASRHTERACTLGQATDMFDALSDGAITSGHVDALTRGTRNLDPTARDTLLSDPDLAEAAARCSVRQFGDVVKRKARALDTSDPDETFERQRRATTMTTFSDAEGMWNLHAKFDPLTGAKIAKQLQSATATKFAEATPDTAPRDPRDRAAHLEAVALADLILVDGHGSCVSGPAATGLRTRPGPPLVVVDATQTDGAGGPVADWGIPVDVPRAVLTEVLGAHDPDVVIVANGAVLHAAGRLDLGRSSRLANRAQRRALAGLYATCAVPNCDAHYDRCRLHHIEHWEQGGTTDIANLLPVCQHHHTLLHESNWDIALGPDRELTIRLPDGRTMRTGPPRRGSP
ncbi:MAG: HNH endonuclease [Ilumatobacter sp.]